MSILRTLGIKYILLGLSLLSRGNTSEKSDDDVVENSEGGVAEGTVEGEEADNEANMADDYSFEDDVLDEFFLAGLVPQESVSEDEGPSKLERIHSREFNVSSGLGAVGTSLYLLLLLALN